MIEQGEGRFFVKAAGDVQGPDRAQLAGRVGVPRQDLAEHSMGLAHVMSGGRAFLKQPPGRAHVPVVMVKLKLARVSRRRAPARSTFTGLALP